MPTPTDGEGCIVVGLATTVRPRAPLVAVNCRQLDDKRCHGFIAIIPRIRAFLAGVVGFPVCNVHSQRIVKKEHVYKLWLEGVDK